MRRRSKIVLGVAAAIVCACTAACAGLLGDFSDGAPPANGPDGCAGSGCTGAPDASGSSDAPATTPDDSSVGQTDAGGEDASDAGTCGSTCAVSFIANGTHTCAVMGDQSVTCWGNNSSGECGSAAAGGPTPTTVPGIGPARLVKAGDTATCALLIDKSVWCWGSNARGTLGVPDASPTANVPPVEVLPPGAAADLTMGAYHACVVTTGTPAQVMCWGGNENGQAGAVDASSVPAPTSLGITDVTLVAAAAFDTCFTRSTAPAGECIGDNTYGELGHGGTDDGGIDDLPHPIPVTVDIGTLGVLKEFYHSSGYHLGAVFESGEFALWGDNSDGQLGPQNDSGAPDPTPALVPFTEVTDIAMTEYATCALRVDGTVWCWGSTADGQTGSTGTLGPVQVEPAQVLGLPDAGATLITTGLAHACVIVAGGGVECWGFNNFGQLGRSTTASFDPTPAPVVF